MLPNSLIVRSKMYARAVVSGYGRGDNAASLAVSSHNAEKNPVLQAHARMCECAFCVWADLDANSVLDWTRRADKGWDVIYRRRLVDIKGTHRRGQYLIWPLNKRHIFHAKRFDDLILVRGDDPEFEIAGIISKIRFAKEHKIASPPHKLDRGTWYMHLDELDLVPRRRRPLI